MHTKLDKRVVTQLGSGIRRIAIFGTGLIGASIGLALRQAGYTGAILGWDVDKAALAQARALGAVDPAMAGEADEDPFVCALAADVIVLAGPVLSIADWLEQLAPVLSPSQLVTDVGSVKGFLVERAGLQYNGENQAAWLPGHPMAGKEQSGAGQAEAGLFLDATWLFTGATLEAPTTLPDHPYTAEWLHWVGGFGSHAVTLAPDRHDALCAAVSHLPQMMASAFAAMLQEQFGRELGGSESGNPALAGQDGALGGIGGRALREMTRLGASPYSMWRDIAMTNEEAIAAALLRMEQELAHLRENLRTPELRDIFTQANAFRAELVAGDGKAQ
jgi:prephenate dehydrogenase